METETAPDVADVSSPGPAVDEADFLQQQVSEAKAALAATLSDAAAALKDGVDPATWARRYPLLAIGSALLAGFAAAAVTIPSKEQQELRKLEKLAKALRPAAPAPSGDKAAAAPTANATADETKKPLWLTILHEAINLLRPALVSMLSAYVGSHASSPPPQADGRPGANGTPGPAAP